MVDPDQGRSADLRRFWRLHGTLGERSNPLAFTVAMVDGFAVPGAPCAKSMRSRPCQAPSITASFVDSRWRTFRSTAVTTTHLPPVVTRSPDFTTLTAA